MMSLFAKVSKAALASMTTSAGCMNRINDRARAWVLETKIRITRKGKGPDHDKGCHQENDKIGRWQVTELLHVTRKYRAGAR